MNLEHNNITYTENRDFIKRRAICLLTDGPFINQLNYKTMNYLVLNTLKAFVTPSDSTLIMYMPSFCNVTFSWLLSIVF